jgi:5-methylcytosine-specific restriction endonuclease McrA
MTDQSDPSKRCATCGEVKPLSLFSKNKGRPDGYQTRCKACIRLENQGYREKNGDHIRAKERERYEANIESILARQSEYRKENADAIRQRRHRYGITHTDVIREQNRKYRTSNAEAIREKNEAYRAANADVTEKLCTKCDQIKPLTSFSRSEDKKDGYKTHCRECRNLAESLYRKANPDNVREYQRRYRKENAEMVREKKRFYHENNPDIHRAASHRRRALIRINGGTFTAKELIAMRAAQNGICAYCQRQHNPQALTIDHVNPLLYGGRNEAANIVLACGKCNRSKGARTPEEWVDRWYN